MQQVQGVWQAKVLISGGADHDEHQGWPKHVGVAFVVLEATSSRLGLLQDVLLAVAMLL